MLLVLAVIILAACKEKIPDDILSEYKMKRILYDYHLALAAAQVQGGDINEGSYVNFQTVLHKYGVKEEDFDRSMVWYSAHATYLQRVYKSVADRIESESKQMGVGVSESETFANFSTTGDTANIWSAGPMFLLSDRINNLQKIVIKADTSFHAGDYYRFSFGAHFVTSAGMRQAYALLRINYTNDSTYSATQMVAGDYTTDIMVPYDEKRADWVTRSIHITMYMPYDESPESFSFFYMTMPALLKYHHMEPKPEVPASDADSTGTAQPDSLALPDSADRRQNMRPEELRKARPVDRTIELEKPTTIEAPKESDVKPNRRIFRRKVQ